MAGFLQPRAHRKIDSCAKKKNTKHAQSHLSPRAQQRAGAATPADDARRQKGMAGARALS